jgi:octopine/nopaline transport system permease protein
VISGGYQTEILRGAYLTLPKGQLEAARVIGMSRLLMLRRIIIPQITRLALPAMGNVWQTIIKESALVSVTGLVEIVRQLNIASGSTHRPFDFYITGAFIYLALSLITDNLFRGAERVLARRGSVG